MDVGIERQLLGNGTTTFWVRENKEVGDLRGQ